MTDKNRTPLEQWTRKKAILLAVVCLVAGIAGGWFIRGPQAPAVTGSAKAASVPAPAGMGASPASQAPSPARLKEMADARAAPLLDKLKQDSNNPDFVRAGAKIDHVTPR